jgi:ribosomal protein S14
VSAPPPEVVSPILVNAERAAASQPSPRTPEREVEGRPMPASCAACGRHHGAIAAELRCCRIEIEALRAIISRFEPAAPRPKAP